MKARRRPVVNCAFGVLITLVLSIIHLPEAAAQSAADFYKGKTVRIIVGYGVGGGYDLYARMLAPYLGNALQATVIVENQPGAGSMLAMNRLYRAPPDGLQIIMASGIASAMQQLLNLPGVAYDLSKVGFIGVVNAPPWMWLGQPTGGTINTTADAMKPGVTINWGGSGQVDGVIDGASIICTVLEMSCKFILGYKGTADVALAMQRKELDLMYVSDDAAATFIKSGQARAISTIARSRSNLFPDIPTIFETVKMNAKQEHWLDFRATLDSLGRVMFAPPGVPSDRLKFLQDALATIVQDPKLLAEGERTLRHIIYRNPAETQRAIERVISAPTAAERAELKYIVMEKYSRR
jgi:tripartite-type tricarboxylate transporter receptor subunit TctC